MAQWFEASHADMDALYEFGSPVSAAHLVAPGGGLAAAVFRFASGVELGAEFVAVISDVTEWTRVERSVQSDEVYRMARERLAGRGVPMVP